MNGPSEHLNWNELSCKDGMWYPSDFIRDGRVFKLAEVFEKIRLACGNKPIVIHSAYRTIEWNQKVGGKPNSQHIQGRALDLGPPQGMGIEQFYSIIRDNAFKFGIHGLGKYSSFVHLDIRPVNSLVMWKGK